MFETALTADGIVAEARQRTGLEDFASDSYREGLELVVDEIGRSPSLTPRGHETLVRTAVLCLSGRLRIDDHLRTHPALLDRPIERPLFILGLPRSGTTLLIDLIAKDPSRRTLLRWESLDAVPPPHPDTMDSDRRMLDLRERLAQALAAGKGNAEKHWEEADGPTEDVYLMAQDFKASYWHTALPHSSYYKDYFLGVDQVSSFLHHRRVLQVLQHHVGGRWSLKSPEHAAHIRELLEVYPDARVVVTHRDPVEVVASHGSLITGFRDRFHSGGPADLTQDLVEVLKEYAYRPLRYRDEHAAAAEGAFYDMHYRRFLTDPIAEIESIYDFLGESLSTEAAARMRAHLAANPQGKHGRHSYDLTLFGISEGHVRETFAEYVERYDVGTR